MPVTTVDIEREIEAKYIYGLRAIFEIDEIFVYNKDDTKTKVIITPEYPQKDVPLKTPHIVVTDIGYQFSLETSIYNNYMRDVVDASGRHIGEQYANVIPYTLTILCIAENYTSKDLANKVIDYITFSAKEVFDLMHLNIRGATKSPASLQQQYPEKVFQTPISVNGYVDWTGTKTMTGAMQKLLQKIRIETNPI